jgi:sirohydrochlorin cobaltochelatase
MAGADFRGDALVLCAHGRGGAAADHHVPEALARDLRARDRFARVDACYLRGSPALADVLAGIAEARVFLVPLLMADGHTSRVVLPEALAGAGAAGARVTVTPPLGTAPGLADLVAKDARAQCDTRGWTPGETTVVVAGHGTKRHAGSALSAEDAARRVAAAGGFRDAAAAFLEQAPFVEDTLRGIAPAPCVVVGFFLDRGDHSADDIPRLIAAAHPNAAYGGALGGDPGLADIVLSLVAGAAAAPDGG